MATIVTSENAQKIFSAIEYAEIRIDMARNFPITIYDESISDKKSRKFFLEDVISAEDLPLLAAKIDDVLANGHKILQSHTRIKTDGVDRWFLIRCERKKEKFGKIHFKGFILDVSGYSGNLDFSWEDSVLIEYKRKDEEKSARIRNRELTLSDILDKDYLKQIQKPLTSAGVYSAIYDESGDLICSSLENEEDIAIINKKYKHKKRVDIRISRVIVANWTISAPNPGLIEKNTELLNVLSQAIMRIANSFAVLYSEMNNSEHANKLLSEHIEQQILINNVYNIILKRKNANEALEAVIKLVGEYMGMRRICVYHDCSDEKMVKLHYEWRSAICTDPAPAVFSYSEVSKIVERLDYTDIYIPSCTSELAEFLPEICTIANLNGDGKRFGIIAYAPLAVGYVPTAQDSKVLRSVSQITATLLLQKQADERLEETDRKLLKLAFYDPTLDIPNRAMLDKHIENELATGDSGAAAVLKITNLNTFNELFGHEYTDSMLRDVARYVTEMPVSNLTVYRFSGNTLMFLLHKTDEAGAKKIVEALLYRFKNPWKHTSGEHYLDAGVGVTLYPGGHISRDTIYRAAALALYKATEYGANSYAFYSQDFESEAGINYGYAQKLRDAINKDMKGFSLKYQPITAVEEEDGGDSQYIQYEVFVNWDVLPTPKLVQLAENMGLDIVIDTWVIKNACAFCKKMREYSPDFSVSLNITPRELRSGSIITMVEKALAETELEGSALSLEIPEKAFSERQDGVLTVLKKLSQIGVRLSIDSFGSDFTGLRMLKHSYMDMVKIDYSLFTNIFGDFDQIWVDTVAKLASSIEKGICVKRVENKEQLDEAKKFGVKYAQGWLFAKPMTGDELMKKLQKTAKKK
ncbi:MAG: bifunctional diguanylate cyclase/phosphodiesterase [Oscillospiraceae bacterium]|nr:bifunctional diguanylate cyclase/phosphodiesterase [Oscillospiraceae bacterium]